MRSIPVVFGDEVIALVKPPSCVQVGSIKESDVAYPARHDIMSIHDDGRQFRVLCRYWRVGTNKGKDSLIRTPVLDRIEVELA